MNLPDMTVQEMRAALEVVCNAYEDTFRVELRQPSSIAFLNTAMVVSLGRRRAAERLAALRSEVRSLTVVTG